MAAILKMATNTKFAFKNYKSSFFKKKLQGYFSCLYAKFYLHLFFSKIEDCAYNQNREFLVSFSRSYHIRQEF
jgi:hypothetical protein